MKGGYPLPMQPYRERMASAPLDTLVVRCYPGEKGVENHYTLYEDDGQTLDYQAGRFATTDLSYENQGDRLVIRMAGSKGSYEGQPRKRAYVVELPGVKAGREVRVNGKRVRASFDGSLQGLVISTRTFAVDKEVVVELTGIQ